MKKFITAILASTILIACGSDDSNPGGPVTGEGALLLAPDNNSECITGVEVNSTQSQVTLEWAAVEGTDTYFVYLKNLSAQTTLQFNAGSQTSYAVTLLKGTPYSWYVTSRKSDGSIGTSQTWKFYNSGPGITNYAPFPADLVSPVMSSTVAPGTIELKWDGQDLDNDIENYAIFMGTAANNLTSVGTTTNEVMPMAVTAGNHYYWKVMTTDGAGNQTTSPVFQFIVQ